MIEHKLLKYRKLSKEKAEYGCQFFQIGQRDGAHPSLEGQQQRRFRHP